jgi:prolyl-tRNA synthetase
MQYTKSFSKTSKTVNADEQSKNAKLLIQAGYIHKEMAGVYSFTPIGYKVLQNIIRIVREEMNKVGGEEMFMTTLQDSNLYKKTDRWDDENVDIWFKTKLKNDTEIGMGFTHEEDITNIATRFINSYKDMPKMAYQFQNKFRNETRAKSGIMRTREFIMKDLYSFAIDTEQHNMIYEKVSQAYTNIFKRLGIGEKTFKTFASGGSFAKYSHEFQTICDAGEDEIYVCDRLNLAINKEVYNDEVLNDLGITRDECRVEVTSEVGNIFSLGTKFSSALDLKYKDEKGEDREVIMGSYGIGPARVMGVMVELLSDEGGLVWPHEVAPYAVHLVSLHKEEGDEVYNYAKDIYEKLTSSGVEVFWDDRTGHGTGEKLADADLLGIPMRVIASSKTLVEGSVEIKERKAKKEDAQIIKTTAFLKSYSVDCE